MSRMIDYILKFWDYDNIMQIAFVKTPGVLIQALVSPSVLGTTCKWYPLVWYKLLHN